MTTISPRIAAHVAEAVPEALRPSWIATTFKGTFGTEGVRAFVETVGCDVVAGDRLTGVASFGGAIAGKHVRIGAFKFAAQLHGSGRLEGQLGNMGLARGTRGTGFGGAFVEHVMERYATAGVDNATLTAGKSVGGYAWARHGFEIATDGATLSQRTLERARVVRDMVERARATGGLDEEQFLRLEPRLVRDGGELPPDALVGVGQLMELDEARSILLGRSWPGIRQVERTNTWWGAGPGASGALPDYATDQAVVGEASRRASSRLVDRLPEAYDPAAARQAFEEEAGLLLSQGPTEARLHFTTGDELVTAVTRHELVLPDGSRAPVDVKAYRDGVVHGREPEALATEALRPKLDAAWRRLGIDQVYDGTPGSPRSTARS